MEIFKRRICAISLMIVATVCTADAQEFLLFEPELQSTNAEFGWDVFAGFYGQPHNSSIGNVSATLTASPSGGFVSSTMNLYAFTTFPTYTFQLTDLETSEAFTSVVLQFATTETVAKAQFELAPDEYISLGARSSLGFDGDDISVNYYWAEWQGLDAADEFEIVLNGMLMHASFCAARIVYVNSNSPMDITFEKDFFLGDVNCDGAVDLLDIAPFIDVITSGEFLDKADMNQDSAIDLLDVELFVSAITG